MEYIVEGSVWHVVGNDDGVRGWRRLTGPKNRQNVWMRKDPVEKSKKVCEMLEEEKKTKASIYILFQQGSLSHLIRK